MSAGQRANDIPVGREFLDGILQNPINRLILDRFAKLGIKDWWLTAGCLAQTSWNIKANRAPDADIAVSVEIRIQARVSIWYPEKFGVPYGGVHAASDGIDRFAYQTSAIGVRKDAGKDGLDAYRIYAPFGLSEVMEGRVIPNTVLPVKRSMRPRSRVGKRFGPICS